MEYALIDKQTNVVENVIVLVNAEAWVPPEDKLLVPLVGEFGMGCIWDGTSFSARPEANPEPAMPTTTPTKEELLAQVQSLQAQIQALG